MSENLKRDDIREWRQRLYLELLFSIIKKDEPFERSTDKLSHCYNCGRTVDPKEEGKHGTCPVCGYLCEHRYWSKEYKEPSIGAWNLRADVDESYARGERWIVHDAEGERELPKEHFYPENRAKKWREGLASI